MSQGKQFTIFAHVNAPNFWKISFAMDIMGLSYDTRWLVADEIKAPEYKKYNPNGRIPVLIDHYNNDLTIWESGAIMLYLIDKYDTEHKISVASPEEKALLTQWLFYQTTAQAPYFGQAHWFAFNHAEKVPSAIERYRNEARRILGVLENVLSERDWLVGGKMTVADLSFVPYNLALAGRVLEKDFDFQKEFPRTFDWHCRVIATECVKTVLQNRSKLIAEGNHKEDEISLLIEVA